VWSAHKAPDAKVPKDKEKKGKRGKKAAKDLRSAR
jgi:hypothetical protein